MDRMQKSVAVGNKSGIYTITNMVNGKVYVGKTVNFRRRLAIYNTAVRQQDVSKINQRFLNSINKHGVHNFLFDVLEECSIPDLADRELYWITQLDSINPSVGYNLRLDSSTGMVVHQSTREKISKRIKMEFESGIRTREAVSKWASGFWKDNPETRVEMARNVSKAKSSYFLQSDKDGNPITLYESIQQVLTAIPGSKWQNVYAACNGSKPSYLGFKWQRLSSPENYLDILSDVEYDVVRLSRNKYRDLGQPCGKDFKRDVWQYFIDGEQVSISFLKEMGLYDAMNLAFHRKKVDEVTTLGVTITRQPIDKLTSLGSIEEDDVESNSD